MTYEYEAKSEKEAIELAMAELGLNADQFDVEILETQKNSLFKKGYVRIRVHPLADVKPAVSAREAVDSSAEPRAKGLFADPLPKGEFEEKLLEYIKLIIEKMGYDITVDVMFREERKLGIRLNSSSSSILIGRKGKNLDALQLLANVYAGRLGHENTRIVLDIENYRIRREETLVRMAYNIADKVRTSRNSVLLEPMNPFERRLVHTTLNDIGDIETKSEGEGLYKQIRVLYKGVR